MRGGKSSSGMMSLGFWFARDVFATSCTCPMMLSRLGPPVEMYFIAYCFCKKSSLAGCTIVSPLVNFRSNCSIKESRSRTSLRAE